MLPDSLFNLFHIDFTSLLGLFFGQGRSRFNRYIDLFEVTKSSIGQACMTIFYLFNGNLYFLSVYRLFLYVFARFLKEFLIVALIIFLYSIIIVHRIIIILAIINIYPPLILSFLWSFLYFLFISHFSAIFLLNFDIPLCIILIYLLGMIFNHNITFYLMNLFYIYHIIYWYLLDLFFIIFFL